MAISMKQSDFEAEDALFELQDLDKIFDVLLYPPGDDVLRGGALLAGPPTSTSLAQHYCRYHTSQ